MLDKGDKIGDYTLVRFLGRGQFGVVWLAEKEIAYSKRKVRHALKFLASFGDEVSIKSVQAEIDTWIEASGHPNVMSVLDMLTHGQHIVIASEFADGGSLMGWLKKSDGKAPSQAEALEMMTGILSGIEHLHSRNVVHRDLKPDNILLQSNCPRITDFGISRIVSAGSMSAVAMGSPFYMSPESFDGSKSTQTDIWSAGVILYEMLTGGHPYSSDTMYGLVNAIRTSEPKPLPDSIPPDLRNVIDTALNKDLEKRYQNAKEMRVAVEQEIYSLKGRSNSFTAPQEEGFVDTPGFIDAGAITLVNVSNEEVIAAYTSNEEIKQRERAERSGEQVDADLPTEQPNREFPAEQIVAEPPVVEPPVIEPPVLEPPKEEIVPEPLQPAPVHEPSRVTAAQTEAKTVAFTYDQPEMETMTSRRIAEAMEQPLQSSGEPFAASQPVHSNKQLVIVGGIAAAAALGLIILIVGAVAVSRTSWFRGADPNTNTAVTNTTANKTVSNPSAPPTDVATSSNPPDGMVYVEGGEFMMGRDNGKIQEESPAHQVSVGPFFIDKFEVTNEKYSEFVRATNHKLPPGWKGGTFRSGEEKLPVAGVNWNDAAEYAKWAGKRLPTEEEWEFAARGKAGLLYPWGNEWQPKLANADRASSSFSAVGTFSGASPFGIFDMVGNAGEWTADDFKAYPNGSLSDVYSGKPNLKTLRGNDFLAPKDFANTTYRAGWPATGAETYSRTGFRCAKNIDR